MGQFIQQIRRIFRRLRRKIRIGFRRLGGALSEMGRGVCIFLVASALFVVVGIILIIAIPKKRAL